MNVEEIADKGMLAMRPDCRDTHTFGIVITATAEANGDMAGFCMRSIGFAEDNPNGPVALLATAIDQLAAAGANAIVMDMPNPN